MLAVLTGKRICVQVCVQILRLSIDKVLAVLLLGTAVYPQVLTSGSPWKVQEFSLYRQDSLPYPLKLYESGLRYCLMSPSRRINPTSQAPCVFFDHEYYIHLITATNTTPPDWSFIREKKFRSGTQLRLYTKTPPLHLLRCTTTRSHTPTPIVHTRPEEFLQSQVPNPPRSSESTCTITSLCYSPGLLYPGRRRVPFAQVA